MKKQLIIAITGLILSWCSCMTKGTTAGSIRTDVLVYGGSSAAVVAAVQVAKMGRSVILLSPDKHLGGLTAGGLGWTDTGNKEVIGGLAREFYHRLYLYYQKPEAWKWEEKAAYGNKGQGTVAIDGNKRTMWIFEPHAAAKVFEDFIKEYEIPVYRAEYLDRDGGLSKKSGSITSIRTLSGKRFEARVYIDATYEGDLMAAAGVTYQVGRESNQQYQEQWNGVQTGVFHHRHHFMYPVDPYLIPGDPSSGLLPRISADTPGPQGSGDSKIQAYCFRMCLTDHPANRVAFTRPEGYDSSQYELLARVFEAGWRELFHKFDPIPNRKTDTNNHGPFSTDNIGMNYEYPEASYEKRRAIIAAHEQYQKGLMYFLATDSRVPADLQKEFSKWGLARDEFIDNGHWPHQIYVREARRMVGTFIMTEHEVMGRRPVPQPVGMGSYTLDSHNVQRYVTSAGLVQNEGDIGVKPPKPYQVAYPALTPQKAECHNLLVPVCLSSSHIAFGSIRMEPVFMILGQSAATAAVLAIELDLPVQEVPYELLKKQLLQDGQVLQWEKR